MAFLSWLESTDYAGWILFSSGWEIMLTFHAIGLAIVVGTVLVLDLRILGWFKPIPYTALGEFLSLAWIGIAINIVSGLSLFTSQATSYITNVPFLIKITLIIIGIVNVAYMRKVLRREAAGWDSSGAVSSLGRGLALSSIVIWTFAVITARLIAYIG
jgi:Family of unknown function (DUF6644)